MRRRLLTASMVLAWGLACAAAAQGYPNRAIRLVIPFPPGGTPDVIARVMAPYLEREIGQSFVIDNRGGANGIIGTDIVAKATPDGYTLLMTPSALIINSMVYKKLPYDVGKDLAPITNVASGVGFLLLVHPSVPAQTVQEFIALAKKREGQLPFGSPGFGNSLHLAHELFNTRAGIKMVHVPYKGLGPAFNALLAGEVQSVIMPPTVALQQVKAGKARLLAFTGEQRWSMMPEVPTLSEAMIPGFVIQAGWFGWFAPAKTPPAIISRLQLEVRKALQLPPVREFLVNGGYEPVGNTPAEFRDFLRDEIRRYAEIVRAAGIKPE